MGFLNDDVTQKHGDISERFQKKTTWAQGKGEELRDGNSYTRYDKNHTYYYYDDDDMRSTDLT